MEPAFPNQLANAKQCPTLPGLLPHGLQQLQSHTGFCEKSTRLHFKVGCAPCQRRVSYRGSESHEKLWLSSRNSAGGPLTFNVWDTAGQDRGCDRFRFRRLGVCGVCVVCGVSCGLWCGVCVCVGRMPFLLGFKGETKGTRKPFWRSTIFSMAESGWQFVHQHLLLVQGRKCSLFNQQHCDSLLERERERERGSSRNLQRHFASCSIIVSGEVWWPS